MSAPEHLDPSELGTKEYWDAAYKLELTNHKSNASDEGTVWFSDASAEERILSHLEGLTDEDILSKEETSFLDLGTGNGHLLFALREECWEGRMVGVDYSARSIVLARQIAETRAQESSDEEEAQRFRDIQFEEWDILQNEPGGWNSDNFAVVLDKGTFDAISLCGEVNPEGKRVSEDYASKVSKLVKPGGLLVITSCNWTSNELRNWFEIPGGLLVYDSSVKYPSFTFGGQTGQQVCTLLFKRKEE